MDGNIDCENNYGFKIGMVFESEQEAYDAYNMYGRCVGFSIRRHKFYRLPNGDLVKRQFCCSFEGKPSKKRTPKKTRPISRTECEAIIEIRLKEDRKYRVTRFVETHNHDLAPSNVVHMLRSQRRIEPAQRKLISNMRAAGIPPGKIHAYLRGEAGGSQNLNMIRSDLKNFSTRERTAFLRQGDAKSVLDYFARKERENKSFFYRIEVTEDNRLSSCFWADAKSRLDYHFFGDVLCFDTTFGTNDYELAFAPLVGVNSHDQTCFFGAALLSDQTTRSFVWLFKMFLEAMGGKEPKVIFTDQDAAITSAIREVFPGAHHRFCLWHILQNAAIHLAYYYTNYINFSNDFHLCIYCGETVDEFESMWKKLMSDYNLGDNPWLKTLYGIREQWALVYGRPHFCAGMTTTQRSESVNSYLKRYFSACLIMRQLVEEFEKAMLNRIDDELYEENKTRDTPDLFCRWEVEREASKVYTRKKFVEFQQQLFKIVDLSVNLEVDDEVPRATSETSQSYTVSDLAGGRNRKVTYSPLDQTVFCSCKKFEFDGILCSHVLKVFREINLKSIPSQYYMKRWSRDAMKGEVFDTQGSPIVVDLDPSFSVRYSELSRLALSAAYKSARTKESSEIAKTDFLHMISKVEGISSPSKENRQGGIEEDSFEANLAAHITIRDPIRKNSRGVTSKRKKSGLEINAKDKRGKPKKISKRVVRQLAIKQKLQQALLDEEENRPSDKDHAQEETESAIMQTEVVDNFPFEVENTTQILYQDTENHTSFVSDELLPSVNKEHNGLSMWDEAFIEPTTSEQVFGAKSCESGGPARKLEFRRPF